MAGSISNGNFNMTQALQNAAQLQSISEAANSEAVTEVVSDAGGSVEGGSATLTEDAVRERSNGEGGNKGEQGEQSQNNSAQSDAGFQKNVQNTGKAARVSTTQGVDSVALTKSSTATASDVKGVAEYSFREVKSEGPVLAEPVTKYSSSELLSIMLKSNIDATNYRIANQQEMTKTQTLDRKAAIKEKAEKMLEYFDQKAKEAARRKNPFLRFFQGLFNVIKGAITGNTDLIKKGSEAMKDSIVGVLEGIAKIVTLIASVVATVVTGGGAAPLILAAAAFILGDVLGDSKVMGKLLELFGVDANSDFGKKLLQGLCMGLQALSAVLSLGSSGVGAIKNVAKSIGSGIKNTLKTATKSVLDGFKKTAQTRMELVSGAVTTATEIASTTQNVINGVESYKAELSRADAEKIKLLLERDNINRDNINEMTEMMMEQYAAMIQTFMEAMSSLNASMVTAARA